MRALDRLLRRLPLVNRPAPLLELLKGGAKFAPHPGIEHAPGYVIRELERHGLLEEGRRVAEEMQREGYGPAMIYAGFEWAYSAVEGRLKELREVGAPREVIEAVKGNYLKKYVSLIPEWAGKMREMMLGTGV